MSGAVTLSLDTQLAALADVAASGDVIGACHTEACAERAALAAQHAADAPVVSTHAVQAMEAVAARSGRAWAGELAGTSQTRPVHLRVMPTHGLQVRVGTLGDECTTLTLVICAVHVALAVATEAIGLGSETSAAAQWRQMVAGIGLAALLALLLRAPHLWRLRWRRFTSARVLPFLRSPTPAKLADALVSAAETMALELAAEAASLRKQPVAGMTTDTAIARLRAAGHAACATSTAAGPAAHRGAPARSVPYLLGDPMTPGTPDALLGADFDGPSPSLAGESNGRAFAPTEEFDTPPRSTARDDDARFALGLAPRFPMPLEIAGQTPAHDRAADVPDTAMVDVAPMCRKHPRRRAPDAAPPPEVMRVPEGGSAYAETSVMTER